ncbi:hypothetical protein [Pantoea agglomerans]|uniref:hypothetical protein n=1 Tax=Enterobacter agglomerans TaxID=549 RepID=UPI0013038C32|nr:hypothetical protein [Pantoea agglomerans]
MADPLSTIIGHLANLVSFKSSLRLLVIAGSIISCWVWVQPQLKPLQIPAELLLTIIVVIGFSIGALITSIAFSIFDSINNLISTKIEERKNAVKESLDKEKADEIVRNKNELLVNSFDSYSFHAKSILLKLINKDDSIKIDEYERHYSDAFKGLLDGKIVLLLKTIDKNVSFCTINPIFRDTLKNLFDKKHKQEVDDLFDLNLPLLSKLLILFKDNVQKDNHVFKTDELFYRSRYQFQPVIRFEIYNDAEFIDDCNIQFYITDHHYPFMVEKEECSLRSYILCHAPEE